MQKGICIYNNSSFIIVLSSSIEYKQYKFITRLPVFSAGYVSEKVGSERFQRKDFSKMTFNISQSYSFVRQFNTKDETKESVAFAEGKLVIDENKIIFTGKDTKGNSYNIAYEGNYTSMIDDTNTENYWKYEPKTPTTKTENFTSATFTDYKDHFQNGTKYLYVLMKKQEN